MAAVSLVSPPTTKHVALSKPRHSLMAKIHRDGCNIPRHSLIAKIHRDGCNVPRHTVDKHKRGIITNNLINSHVLYTSLAMNARQMMAK